MTKFKAKEKTAHVRSALRQLVPRALMRDAARLGGRAFAVKTRPVAKPPIGPRVISSRADVLASWLLRATLA